MTGVAGDSGARLAVDIGGTFTDVVLLDPSSGRLVVAKVLTTPDEPASGVMLGVVQAARRADIALDRIDEMIHATTLVTNAVIERKGAATALVTTRGFRDLAQMGRETSYDSYDLALRLPPPLVERHWRFGVKERMSGRGESLEPPDETEIRTLCARLLDEGVQSVAVCFLNAFSNVAHEQQVARWIADAAPGMHITTSTEVSRELREYERFTTALVNAYTKPITVAYLTRLQERLDEDGFRGTFRMMQSNGGLVNAAAAQAFPVRLIESGPAAGALAVAYYCQLTGMHNVVGFDLGGTTAKICIVDELKPWITPEFEVAREARFKKGSGLPLLIPSVDLLEIGAGGGSIARVDELGLLKVGPDSASSRPGPACYALGGEQATVTDANLRLGYLNPEHFAGGEIRLDAAAAGAALDRVAQPLGLDRDTVAGGIFEVVNESMASAARVHITESGRNPSAFAMVAFGGGGPIHAFDLASRLGIATVLIPLHGGVASAVGLLTSSTRLDVIRTKGCMLRSTDWSIVEGLFAQMVAEAHEQMPQASGFALERSIDARYAGQGFQLHVPLPDGALSAQRLPEIEAAFLDVYQRTFGKSLAGMAIEVLNWRLSLVGPAPQLFLPAQPDQAHSRTGKLAPHHHRPVRFPGRAQAQECAVYRHDALSVGDRMAGPCLVEQRESTAVVGPGGSFEVDAFLNLIIHVPPARTHDA